MNKALISLLVACVLLAPVVLAASEAPGPFAVAGPEMKLVLSQKLEPGELKYKFEKPVTVSIISDKVKYAQSDSSALRPTPPIVSFEVESIEFPSALSETEVNGYEVDASGFIVVFHPTTQQLAYQVLDCTQSTPHAELLTTEEEFFCTERKYPLPGSLGKWRGQSLVGQRDRKSRLFGGAIA